MRLWFGIVICIAANCLWGLGYLIPHVLESVDPILLTTGRYTAYGVLSGLLLVTTSRQVLVSLRWQDWLWGCGMALTGNVAYYIILILSIRSSGLALAALIVGTLPVTMALYGTLSAGEAPPRKLLLPLGLILVGLVGLNGLKFASVTTPLEHYHLVLGIICALGALALWTWYGVKNSQYLKNNPEVSGAEWAAVTGVCSLALMAVSLPLLTALGLWSTTGAEVLFSSPRSAANYFLASLLLGVVVSWLATLLWNVGARNLPVNLAGQLIVFDTLASLVYASLADWTVPPTHELVSMLVIIVGVVLGVRVTLRSECKEGAATSVLREPEEKLLDREAIPSCRMTVIQDEVRTAPGHADLVGRLS